MELRVQEEISINFCKINMLTHKKLKISVNYLRKIFNKRNKNLPINQKLIKIFPEENKVIRVQLFLKDFMR